MVAPLHTGPFDSHCHFERQDDIAALLDEARRCGLNGLLATGGTSEANETALEAAAIAPDFALAAVGFEPDAVSEVAPRQAVESVFENASKIYCVGEIGLEYSHGEDADTRKAQRELFAAQVSLASTLALPCSIHTRGAEEDVAAILAERISPEMAASGRSGVIHCFTGPASFAEKLVPLGLSFGLSGILTFPNATALRDAVLELPRDRILVETDSPYLAPAPHRGERCRPAFSIHTASLLAALLNLSREDAFALCSANARRIFCAPGSSTGMRSGFIV